MGNYKIFIKDEKENYKICVRNKEGLLARFASESDAKAYAERLGLKSGYIIKK